MSEPKTTDLDVEIWRANVIGAETVLRAAALALDQTPAARALDKARKAFEATPEHQAVLAAEETVDLAIGNREIAAHCESCGCPLLGTEYVTDEDHSAEWCLAFATEREEDCPRKRHPGAFPA